jgi:RimJ/RimL family protein N-acetyltransferase
MSTGRTILFKTPRLVIRLATAADAQLYLDLWTNPQVMSNVGFPKGLRIVHDELLERLRAQGPSEYDRLLVAELQSTSEAIGECHMHTPNEEGIAETDIKLLPAFWGNKYGVEIKRGLVDYLFTHTDCTAIEASPNVGNAASIKMQEAVGGVRVSEGTFEFPESMRAFTTPVHTYVYRVYRDTWEKFQSEESAHEQA